MSDGPHKSLPMRRGWRRVAECADNQAFEAEEIRNAMIPALIEDCRGEISPEFVGGFCRVCRDQEGSLFKDDVMPSLEALRNSAGCGMGRTILDYAAQAAANGSTGMDIAEKAATQALTDRAAKGAKQVEEHYLRESTKPRASRVRERIEEGITGADMRSVARTVLNLEEKGSTAQPLKRRGLDDGVKL